MCIHIDIYICFFKINICIHIGFSYGIEVRLFFLHKHGAVDEVGGSFLSEAKNGGLRFHLVVAELVMT